MANLLERITSDPEICGGRPCIRGLRVRVKDILEMLVGGSTRAEILGDYPYLQDEDSRRRSNSRRARQIIRCRQALSREVSRRCEAAGACRDIDARAAWNELNCLTQRPLFS
jgi:uncharacterized protein (DUF433 family)